MSQELVTIENNLPSTGMENIKLTPSTVRLVQPTSKNVPEGVNLGTFLDSLDNEAVKSFGAIVLSISLNRNYYPKGNSDFNGPPDCKSLNGLTPDPTSAVIQSNSCETCPKKNWGPKVNGKASKPECSESYRLLYLEEVTRLPKITYIRGLGVKPFGQLLKLIQAKIQIGKRQNKALDLYSFRITFSAKKTGAVYEPVFSDVREHGEDVSAELKTYVYDFHKHVVELETQEEFNTVIEAEFEQV